MQANNAYIFPAIGFAAILTRASHISDDAFLVAAKCLSEMTQKAVSSLPCGLIPCLFVSAGMTRGQCDPPWSSQVCQNILPKRSFVLVLCL